MHESPDARTMQAAMLQPSAVEQERMREARIELYYQEAQRQADADQARHPALRFVDPVDSLYPNEQRFMREVGATIRNGLAVIGALALIVTLVFGGHVYNAMVFYHLYLSGQ
jgi:hypothetical protein